jgi:hypothetical protein
MLRSEAKNVSYFVEFIGRAWSGRHYEDRIALMTSQAPFQGSVFVIAPPHDSNKQKKRCVHDHDRCVASVEYTFSQKIREKSNFSLVLRGDTPGSDRWQNSMAAGAIPVGVGANRQEILGWLPFQSMIPWDDIVISIPRSEFIASAVGSTNKLLSIPEKEIQRKRALMRLYHADYDWAAYQTRMPDNFIREAFVTKCSFYNKVATAPSSDAVKHT